MKVHFLVLLITFLTVASFGSQNKIENPYLFKIEKDGHTSYVLGTYHLYFSFYDFPQYLMEAFKKSQTVALETIEHSENQINKKEEDPSTKNDPVELSKATTKKLIERGLPLEVIKSIDPEGLCFAYLYTEVVVSNGKKAESMTMMDDQIEKKAKSLKKNLAQLDDEQQLSEISDNTGSCNIEDLVQSIAPAEAKQMFIDSINQYKLGDIENAQNDDQSSDELFQTKARNQTWLTKIIKLHKNGPVFIAVGNAHLGGYEGILYLLRANGFKITRVESAADL